MSRPPVQDPEQNQQTLFSSSCQKRTRFMLVVLVIANLAQGCAEQSPPLDQNLTAQSSDPSDLGAGQGLQRTPRRLKSEQAFSQYSMAHRGIEELKFIVTHFDSNEQRSLTFLNANFYLFHDEWYWFQLLNGEKVPGESLSPSPIKNRFKTPQEAAVWGKQQSKLPLGLSITDGRLYAERFYASALERTPARFGLGSIIRFKAQKAPTRDDIWAFKLEYSDKISVAKLQKYFSLLEGALPPSIHQRLKYVARSPQQHAFIKILKEKHHALAPRLLKLSALSTPGATEIYNPGLTAGILRIVSKEQMGSLTSTPEEILIVPYLPDSLPLSAGIISEVPQTPLSHINLLAKNRGIPNVYLGDAAQDAQLQQLAHDDMPVVLRADEHGLRVEALDRDIYALWKKLSKPVAREVPTIDTTRLPYTIIPRASDFTHPREHVPAIGGKSSGYLALLSAGVSTPDSALLISVRAFAEHLAPLKSLVRAALQEPAFEQSSLLRYLVLEGPERYLKRFTRHRAWIKRARVGEFGASISKLVNQGGVRGAIERRAIDRKTLALIKRELEKQFSDLAPSQGLRFRSSSSLEDIEGFNGAGLYSSHTGYLHPETLASQKDRERTIASALKRTWSSYFSFEAFEERRLARIEHLSGNMGVLVHARFDDKWELANGVFTLTIDGAATAQNGRNKYTLELNVQAGAESVTNARSGETPYVVQMTQTNARSSVRTKFLSRAKGSSARKNPLDSSTLMQVFRDAVRVGSQWIKRENQGLTPPRKRRGIVLDFEFRYMASAWPARKQGSHSTAPRMIIKQVRSLEPAAITSSVSLSLLPIPREVLARAVRAEKIRCKSPSIEVEVLWIWADALASDGAAASKDAFAAEVSIKHSSAGVGKIRKNLDHLSIKSASSPSESKAEKNRNWRVVLRTNRQQQTIQSIELHEGKLRLAAATGETSVESALCTTEVLLDHPDRLLREE